MDMKVNIPQMHLEKFWVPFLTLQICYNFFGKTQKNLKKKEMKKR
jgi:hypothetical protein